MNLLPPPYKSELGFEAWRPFLRSWALSYTFVGLVASALLLPSYFFLSFEQAEIERNLETQQKSRLVRNVTEGEKQIRAVNETLARIVSFEKEGTKFAPLFEKIIATAQSGISLGSFRYDREHLTIELSGIAATRDGYLAFVETLKGVPQITNVDPPESNLLLETNVAFTIKATLTHDAN